MFIIASIAVLALVLAGIALFLVLKLRGAFIVLCATIVKLCKDLELALKADEEQPAQNTITYMSAEEFEELLKGQGPKKDLN
jgi:hypothetical protein